MPNDPGSSSFLASQYRKFLEGLEQTGIPNAPRLARVEAPVRVERPKEPQITIPAWGDVIRTGPRTIVTPEDIAIHRHFERAGLPSPLGSHVTQEILDRRAMAERIRNSATPEYQRGVGTMMTAVDNVQDSALALAVGGRITATALGRFGSWIAPAVAGMASIARALSWLGIALGIFGVVYAWACQGPRHAAAQARSLAMAGYLFKGIRKVLPRARGVPTPFPTAGAKGHYGMASFSRPSGRLPDNARASRWAKVKPSFGEVLQIAQVAYDFTGYGVALGAIMGFSTETAYAGARKQRGEDTKLRSPAVNHELARILGSRVAGLGRAALWHRQVCARALASAPLILRDPTSWGDELYGLTWLVFYASLEPLMWDTQGLPWRDPVIASVGGASWEPWDVHDPVTRALLTTDEQDPAELRWPIPGAPAELSADRIMLELGKEIATALERWLEEDVNDPWRSFVAEMSMYVTERVWWWLEGAPDWPRWKLSPFSAVWESLFLASRWPIVSDPPELLVAAWAASEQYVRDSGRQMIPVDELDRIWTDAGSPLLVLRGPDAEMPAEFFAAWDEESGDPGDVSFGHDVADARRRLEELRRSEAPQSPQDQRSSPVEG